MEDVIQIESSNMYPDWVKFYVPSTQNIFYLERLDLYAEEKAIREQIESTGTTDYKISTQHDGFVIHCPNKSIAGQISIAIDYPNRCKQHDEENAWMYED
ncbi:MAG: hypothetical protein MRY83_01935 [Flavobacteriales bacterium]|nr:hypothetical protein [Flavobacteriales bacterium]